MRLGKQLFLIFCLASLLPMIMLWGLLGSKTYQKELDDVSNRHLLIAKNLGATLDRYHTDVVSGFNVVADNLIANGHFVNSQSIISSLHFRHFCIANWQTGVVTKAAAPDAVPCPKVIPQKRMNLFKSFVHGAKANVSPVLAAPDGKPTIYVLKRVGDQLAIGAITTTYFARLGKAVSFGKKGHAAIVDQRGNVLAHPNKNWIKTRKNIAEISIIKDMLAGKAGVAKFYSPAMKTDMIAGYSGAGKNGWSVMIPQPISELATQARAALNSIFPIIAFCVILAGLAAVFAARMMLRPLTGVIAGAREVEQGNADVQVDVNDNWAVPRELKDLQERFNAMAKAVSKYQAQQRVGREVAEADTKNKSEYLANLGHELKTPLNSIIGFSSVLRQASPGQHTQHDTNEFLGHIEKSAGHLLSFVNDLLDLNRLDMGAHKLNEQEFHLIDVIRFCETTLRRKIEEKHISLVVDCPDKDIKIFADERSVNQILINLTANAIRYSLEKGKIRFSASKLSNGDVRIDVHDNGIGIPEQDIEEILLPFRRSSDPQIAEIHGTGIGLSIVSKLARLQDMEFIIESEHGFSTTATLIIPKSRVVDVTAKVDAA